MSNLDLPLDDIIQTKKSMARRGGKGGAAKGPQVARRSNPPKQQGPQQQAAKPKQVQSSMPIGTKIVVSNLPGDVTEAQVKELFSTTVGPLRSASLAYNSSGKSTGVATIEFNKTEHATKAYKDFNARLVDGRRPLKVEIIVDPSRQNDSLGARLGVAPSAAGKKQQPKAAAGSSTVAAAGGAARQPRGTGGRRGGRGGGAGGRVKEPKRPAATVESLDAEMSDYQASAKDVVA
ncbi:hypothetical protein RQP46_005334 [Phenoliferia psychrophenolica]